MRERASAYRFHLTVYRETLFGSDRSSALPLETVRAYSREIDRILREIYASMIEPEGPERSVCMVALGGYGRRELYPFSDVDILILHEGGHATEKIASAVRLFWDIGLTMGCVVRTLPECAAILGQDMATDTALLESRYLAGHRDLFQKLQRSLVQPFFEKQKKTYLDEISSALREGLFSSENSLYRVEPHLKNGVCCLRDCQRLLWAERVRNGVQDFKGLHPQSHFSSTQVARLETDYAFLMGLRIALHWLCQRRMDILETALQPMIAARCGFGSDGAGKLMEQFFKTVRDVRLLLLSFLERDLSGRNIWGIVRKRVSANQLGPGIAVLDGILFSTRSGDTRIGTAIWLMDVFKHAMVHRATLSVELRNRLRHLISHLEPRAFKSQTMGNAFRAILSCPEPFGPVVQMMHETGLLSRLIPQFDTLTCKVEYDSYHEYTMDQHILLTLQTADAFAAAPDEKIQGIYRNLKRPLLLRLALLLHDIGKAQAGDHAHNGAIIAENVCERLGLNGEETEQVRFLVYHHLDMSNLSLLREPEDQNIRQFAETLPDREALDLLYLLTIADIRSVGRRTWTDWKAFQLDQLYDRTRAILDQPRERPLMAGMDVLAGAYLQDTLPEERARHRQWLDEMDQQDLQLHNESFAGFERLTVCGRDRMGFLSDMIGCISSEGYNILSARVYSTDDGKVLDIFNLEPPARPRLSPETRMRNMDKKWRLLAQGDITADSLVAERISKYPPEPLRISSQQPPVRVQADNSASPLCTILEISTADNFGLLHKIVRCLSENRVNIISARLSTRIDQAVDVFYVTDVSKRKMTNQARIDPIIDQLIRALH
jgi:[protein-PII] uridylyltransferase